MIPGSSSSDSAVPDVDDLDLSAFYAKAKHSHAKPDEMTNGHHRCASDRQRIFREGEITTLPTQPQSQQTPFKVLLLEPVQQGILTPLTRIIIPTTPQTINTQTNGDVGDEISENGSTHVSLAEFDADAFLASSLALSLPKPSTSPELDGREMTISPSSDGSGSLTPRPTGTRMSTPPSSPAAGAQGLVVDEEDVGGTRSTAVKAMGPSAGAGHGIDVCWVGVGGLGRAGIFEGDWVGHVLYPPVRS